MGMHTKKRTNVSIDGELLAEARERGMKLSPLLEEAIQRKLSEDAAETWLAENAAAIKAYNKDIAERGVFSDRLRRF
ncbi:MAG: acetoacetyl-CoA synthase [Spirochaetes bacterium]|jgi:antitoxin CcdA|nr:acetoacetyl-CoA synthase [Spirochaetota bacterium]